MFKQFNEPIISKRELIFYTKISNIRDRDERVDHMWKCLCGVMIKVMNCGIVVSEFEIQSCYYVHYRTNTLGNGRKPLILPAMG